MSASCKPEKLSVLTLSDFKDGWKPTAQICRKLSILKSSDFKDGWKPTAQICRKLSILKFSDFKESEKTDSIQHYEKMVLVKTLLHSQLFDDGKIFRFCPMLNMKSGL